MQIRPDRKISMAMKWLILYSRRNEKINGSAISKRMFSSAAKEEGITLLRKNGYSQNGRN
jgi:small subunit ribosomal protein S7